MCNKRTGRSRLAKSFKRIKLHHEPVFILTAVFQLFSSDLSLRYKNISVEPYGKVTVDERVPEAASTTGRRATGGVDISGAIMFDAIPLIF